MLRLLLTDELWLKLEPSLISAGLYGTVGLRLRLEAILWKLRTGAPWRDLPAGLGPWSSAFNQFNRWSARGVWQKAFEAMRGELSNGQNFMDATIVRAHQHAAGARQGQEAAIGNSRGGRTSKLHVLADGNGKPITFEITAGQCHDMTEANNLLGSCVAEQLINDKGYDSDELRENARIKGIRPVIPRRKTSKKANPDFDPQLYRLRHRVENLFARLKQFRSLATRYEKLKRNYEAITYIACLLVWLKS